MTKICNKCKHDKPFADFPKGRDANGLYYICNQCVNERNQLLYRSKDPLTRWVDTTTNDIRSRAKRNSIPFALTKAMLRLMFTDQCGVCVYCGCKFDMNGTRHDHRASPSVDRLDPTLGYTTDNVVLCCHRCNAIKNDATLLELRTITESLSVLLAARLAPQHVQ